MVISKLLFLSSTAPATSSCGSSFFLLIVKATDFVTDIQIFNDLWTFCFCRKAILDFKQRRTFVLFDSLTILSKTFCYIPVIKAKYSNKKPLNGMKTECSNHIPNLQKSSLSIETHIVTSVTYAWINGWWDCIFWILINILFTENCIRVFTEDRLSRTIALLLVIAVVCNYNQFLGKKHVPVPCNQM